MRNAKFVSKWVRMLEKLKAEGLHKLVGLVDDWRQKYHVTKEGDIVFQNKKLMTNVFFTNNSLHAIQGHPRGADSLPATISQPDEVWGTWEDPKEQKVVLRNYLKFGRNTAYIVQTRNGVIVDALAVSINSANKYRKGVDYGI